MTATATPEIDLDQIREGQDAEDAHALAVFEETVASIARGQDIAQEELAAIRRAACKSTEELLDAIRMEKERVDIAKQLQREPEIGSKLHQVDDQIGEAAREFQKVQAAYEAKVNPLVGQREKLLQEQQNLENQKRRLRALAPQTIRAEVARINERLQEIQAEWRVARDDKERFAGEMSELEYRQRNRPSAMPEHTARQHAREDAEFVARVNDRVERAQARITALEEERDGLATRSRELSEEALHVEDI